MAGEQTKRPVNGYHSSKWYKNHPEVPKPEVRPKTSNENLRQAIVRVEPIMARMRPLGFVSFALAIGAILMENNFWWFVGFVYVALMLSFLDSWTERPLGWLRYTFMGFFLIFVGWFSYAVVLGGVYPERVSTWTEGNYPKGQNVHGLIWQDGWSDLRFSIFNHSMDDLKDVDVEFLTDESVAKVALISELGCKVVHSGPNFEARLNYKDGHQELMHHLGSQNDSYHILCDKIPGNIGVEVVVAVENTNELQDLFSGQSKQLDSLIGSKMMPSVIKYHMKYKVGIRPYSWGGSIAPQHI